MHEVSRRFCDQVERTGSLLVLLATMSFASAVGADPAAGAEPLERILETARAFVAESLGSNDQAETRIEVGQLDARLILTRCDSAPTAQFAPGARAIGNSTVNVRCESPAPWSIYVPVKIQRYANVVVAARPLARQQPIGPDDIRLERRDTSTLIAGYLDTPESAIGLQAKRPLSAGQVLTHSLLVRRKLIERGQLVNIISARPGLNVRMSGEALEDGVAGQRIRVRNRASKKIVEGYVESSGSVRIEP